MPAVVPPPTSGPSCHDLMKRRGAHTGRRSESAAVDSRMVLKRCKAQKAPFGKDYSVSIAYSVLGWLGLDDGVVDG